MSLLSRHILRSLAAPFGWGVVALTGLLLLNTLAPLIDNLGGKGLGWMIMVQAIVLAIPALIVLTLPMAALVASLYGFGQLAADMEMVAMYANGVSVWRMARPALIGAGLVTLVNFLLFDQFVPNSNARYRALLTAVGNKHPTLALRAGELNRLGSSAPYIMRADQIDSGGVVRGVTIYVLSTAETRRVIRADSGYMVIAPNGRDMLVTLYHGTSIDFRTAARGRVEHSSFESNRFRLADVTNQLQRSDELSRGDRELSSCQLLDGISDQAWYIEDGTRGQEHLTRRDLRRLTGLAPLTPPALRGKPPVEKHCGVYRKFEDWLQRRLLPPAALAALVADSIADAERFRLLTRERAYQDSITRSATSPDQPAGLPLNNDVQPRPPVAVDSTRIPVPPDSLRPPVIPDSLTTAAPPIPDSLATTVRPPLPDSLRIAQALAQGAPLTQLGVPPADSFPTVLARPIDPATPANLAQLGISRGPHDVVTTVMEIQGVRQEANGARLQSAAYRVEYHKKYAIPLASFCFVLLGLALALKYPGGGIGLVIGGSLVIFMIFYVLISAGESLAKKEFLNPVIAMHGPLVLFTILGLLAVSSANREMGSARSGGLFAPVADFFARLRGA